MRKNLEDELDLESFGGRLYYVMRVKKITQKELANKVGVTERSISNYIHDKSFPSCETLVRIVGILGTSIEYLTGRYGGKIDDPYLGFNVAKNAIKSCKKAWSEEQKNELFKALF